MSAFPSAEARGPPPRLAWPFCGQLYPRTGQRGRGWGGGLTFSAQCRPTSQTAQAQGCPGIHAVKVSWSVVLPSLPPHHGADPHEPLARSSPSTLVVASLCYPGGSRGSGMLSDSAPVAQ